jgi:hypothetical protein
MQVSWLTEGGSHGQQPTYTSLPPHLSKQVLATKHSMISHIAPLPPCPGAPALPGLPPVPPLAPLPAVPAGAPALPACALPPDGPPAVGWLPPRPPLELPLAPPPTPAFAVLEPATEGSVPAVFSAPLLPAPLPAPPSLDENSDEQPRHAHKLAAPSQKPRSSECPRARLMVREYHARA